MTNSICFLAKVTFEMETNKVRSSQFTTVPELKNCLAAATPLS